MIKNIFINFFVVLICHFIHSFEPTADVTLSPYEPNGIKHKCTKCIVTFVETPVPIRLQDAC